MKQIFLKVYKNGKTSTNASVINFDREHKSGEIVIDYSLTDYVGWDKQLDLIFADGTTAFVTGNGETLTVPLLESYLKKGSMTVQPIAKRLVGGEVEKAKWQVVALSVRDSLNVLENDVTVTVSIAEQMQAEIDEFKDAEAVRVQNEIDRESSEGIRESSEVTRGQNESIRESNENTRISNEQARVIAEPLRITAEQGRVIAEDVRVGSEQGRVTAEGLRVSAEQGRASAESTRVTQETGRVNAEGVRESSELLRIENENTRILNEQGRVSGESNRVLSENTRSSNEATRLSNESARVSSESTRQSNESSRVGSENSRVSSENARLSSESTRVANENTRISQENTRVAQENARNVFVAYNPLTPYVVGNKVSYLGSSYICILNSTGNLPTNTTYWLLMASKGDNTTADAVANTPSGNISATTVQGAINELDTEKADRLFATNLVTNGDFSNGTTGWFSASSTISATNNTLSIVGTGGQSYAGSIFSFPTKLANRKYYWKLKIRTTGAGAIYIRCFCNSAVLDRMIFAVDNPVQNQWYEASVVLSPITDISNIQCYMYYATASEIVNKTMEVQYVLGVDLTTTFGAGNEPTTQQMDWLLAQKFTNSWFDGTTSLVSTTELIKKAHLLETTKVDKVTGKSLVSDTAITDLTDGNETTLHKHSVSNITNIPSGNISSNTVQGAINELDTEKADKLFATNLVTNGDFSNGTTGWTPSASVLSVANNTLYVSGDGFQSYPRISKGVGINAKNNTVYYVSGRFKITNNVCTKAEFVFDTSSSIGFIITQNTPTMGTWYNASQRVTWNQGNENQELTIRFRHFYADATTANGKVMEVQYVQALDLTAIFGAGNEPTKEQMDRLLSIYPNSWFNGTAEITNIKQVFNEKADKLFATNLVTNGDFSNGTTGCIQDGSTLSASNYVLSSTGNGASQYVSYKHITTLKNVVNRKIFYRFAAKVTNSSSSGIYSYLIGSTSGQISGISVLTPAQNQIYNFSAIVTTTSALVGELIHLKLMHMYADAATANGKVMEVQYVQALDLTSIFGAGKEPTKEQVDWLLAQKYTNSWFDGTKELCSITDLLTLVNTKANITQEAWITPTLLNGWVQNANEVTRYRKNSLGVVEVEISVRNGTSVVFNFPASYRPLSFLYVVGIGGSTIAQCSVSTNGDVTIPVGSGFTRFRFQFSTV